MTDHRQHQPRKSPGSRHLSRPSLLCAGLLFCAYPVSAQTITVNSGAATVSGTGTAVVGAGTDFGGGAGSATTSYVTGKATGEGLSGPSTLNLTSGGNIQNITAELGGIANISGGSAGNATAGSYGTINITGGTVQTAGTGNDFGSLLISGGMVHYASSGSGASSIFNRLTISGGTVGGVGFGYTGVSITGGTVGLVSPNGSYGRVNVSGGDIQEIDSPYGVTMNGGTAQVVNGGSFGDNSSNSSFTGGTIQTLNLLGGDSNKISGGTITSLNDKGANTNIEVSGGSFQFITNSDDSNIINITGTSLKKIDILDSSPYTGLFHLTGILTDGETLDATYAELLGFPPQLEFNGVTAVAVPVPESSPCASLGLMLLLSGTSIVLCARKRRTD